MQQTLYSVQDLAERWGISQASVRNMELDGKLHRVPDIPGIRFTAMEVTRLESIGVEAEAMSAWERRRLQDEIKELREENENLRQRLLQAQNVLMGV